MRPCVHTTVPGPYAGGGRHPCKLLARSTVGVACTLSGLNPPVSGSQPRVEVTIKPSPCGSRFWTLLHSLSLGYPPHPQGILCSAWLCSAAPHRDQRPVNFLFLGKAPGLCPYIPHSIFIKILFH
ncbi:Max dimerization protein 3, isoform CRA_c, partial [Rattus norvegicus]